MLGLRGTVLSIEIIVQKTIITRKYKYNAFSQ